MNHKPLSKTWLLLSIFVFFLTFAYFGFIYFSHDLQRFGMLFNADSLYLPALLKNLFIENGTWKDWSLPPAPYFFPDLPLYSIAYAITKAPYFAQFFFALFQGLFVLITIYGINRLFFSGTQALYHAVLVVALMYLSVLGHPTIHAVISGHHFGTFLSVLMAIYVLARFIQAEGRGFGITTILVLLISLTVASDKLFIIQFVIPLIVTVTILSFLNVLSLRIFSRIIGISLCGAAIGYLLYYLWVPNPTSFTPEFGLSNLTSNLPVIYTLFYKVISNNIFYSLIFIIFYVLIFYKLAWTLFTKKTPDSIITTIIFLLTSITFFNVFVIAISDLTIDFRYFIPVFFMPLLLMPLLLYMLSINQWQAFLPRMALILVALCMGFNFINKYTSHPIRSNYYPKAVQCFDDFIDITKARSGIAHYWDAKRTAVLSQRPVTIAAYTTHIEAYNWISTKQWQQRRYDFVLMRNQNYPQHQLNLERLKELSPKQIIGHYECGLFDIYYFPQGLYTEPGL